MKSSQHFKTTGTRRKIISLNGLVTHKEVTAESLQTLDANTSKGKNTTRSHGSYEFIDIDEYQDGIQSKYDSLFISPEQQHRINQILQFARKGKINQGNAFDVPMKVIHSEDGQNTSLRFWKFASQLLGVSINVYDKRVQNVFSNTNKMFDNLVRCNQNQDQDLSQSTIKSKTNKKAPQYLEMQDFIGMPVMSLAEIGNAHTEDPPKLNIKNINNQMVTDPLFQKMTKKFDSNSLSSLFLNTFSCNSNLQIQYYKSNLPFKEEEVEATQLKDKDDKIPDFVQKQLKKLNFIAQTQEMLLDIKLLELSHIKQQNSMQFNELSRMFEMYGKQERYFGQQNAQFQSNNDKLKSQFNFNFLTEQIKSCSLENRPLQSNKIPSSKCSQQQNLHRQFLGYDDFDSSHSAMTPNQLQFKGLKLIRKKLLRKNNNRVNNLQIKQDDTQIIIQIQLQDIFTHPQRNQIIMAVTRQPYQTPQKQDLFIMPHNIQYIVQLHRKKIRLSNSNHSPSFQYMLTPKIHKAYLTNDYTPNKEIIADEYATMYHNQQSKEQTNFETNNSYNTLKESTFFKSFGAKNIRQAKTQIYQRVLNEQSIRISDIHLPISIAGIFIIFLHLVNQQNMNIRTSQDQSDITLSISQ